ncbi:glycosyltransferase family 4 protein [Raoultella planticola]|uniref:glycosyltransferase family 4 protein n=1 Tax=Raoultella planticola TaxID=575 RepID=UPI00051751CF|nr:glycosyltransferase family 4 protein [Raoultella planticola]
MIYRIVGMNLSGGARRYCYILNDELKKRKLVTKTFIPKSPISDKYSDADKVPFDYVNTNEWGRVAKEIIKQRKNIRYVHLHLPNVCIRFYLLLKLLNIPYIITVHSPLYNEIGLKSKIHRKIYKNALSNANLCIFISEFVKENIRNNLKLKKISGKVIYNGSEDPFFGETILDNYLDGKESGTEFRICIVGELTERKGLLDLEHIIKVLKNKIANTSRKIVFNIYGEGPLLYFVEKLQYDFGEIIEINIRGYVRDLSEIYTNNDLHIMLSKDEAFGRVITEAMAYLVPTLCYNKGAFPELIENEVDGLLVDDPIMLAEKIMWLSSNSAVHKNMCYGAREKFLKRFESNIFVNNTLNAIDEVVKA